MTLPFLGGQFRHRHFPIFSGGVEQHLARLRAGQSQRHEIAGYSYAGRGDLRPVEQAMTIAVDFRVSGRELDLHFRPVGIELFREDQGQ